MRKQNVSVLALLTGLSIVGCGSESAGSAGGGTGAAAALNSFKTEPLDQEKAGTRAKAADEALASIEKTFSFAEFGAKLHSNDNLSSDAFAMSFRMEDPPPPTEFESVKVGDACDKGFEALGSSVSFHKLIGSVKGLTAKMATMTKEALPPGFKSAAPKDARASVAFTVEPDGNSTGTQAAAQTTLSIGASGSQVFFSIDMSAAQSANMNYNVLIDTDKKTMNAETTVKLNTATGSNEKQGASEMKSVMKMSSTLDAVAKTIKEELSANVDFGEAFKLLMGGTSDISRKSDSELSIKSKVTADVIQNGQSKPQTQTLDATLKRENNECKVSHWAATKS